MSDILSRYVRLNICRLKNKSRRILFFNSKTYRLLRTHSYYEVFNKTISYARARDNMLSVELRVYWNI